jgi:hypothetical protein
MRLSSAEPSPPPPNLKRPNRRLQNQWQNPSPASQKNDKLRGATGAAHRQGGTVAGLIWRLSLLPDSHQVPLDGQKALHRRCEGGSLLAAFAERQPL